VTGFGQSGSLEDVYRHHGLDTGTIIRAALDVTHR
jgi:pyruvate dehydrogenase E1 component